jgi:hypothetical protein
MNVFLKTSICLSILFSTIPPITQAKPSAGSCVNYDFPTASTDSETIDTTVPVRVLRQGAPLYRYPNRFKVIKLLDFDTDLRPLRQTFRRVQVKESSSVIGWVYKKDLLCQIEHPLTKKGLPRQAFVKTLMNNGFKSAVPIYNSPNRKCHPSCQLIDDISQDSKLNSYFVFSKDKDNRRYLLAEEFTLSGGFKRFPLVGWIDEEKMMAWHTHLSLRPKKAAVSASALGSILAYNTLPDSQKNNNAIQVDEKSWYRLPWYIPLLDKKDGHYHVILPQCRKKMPCTRNFWVRDFYIPIKTGQMQEEVVLIEQHIDKWIKLLNPLVRLGNRANARDNREQFVELLREELMDIIGAQPLEIEETSTLADIFQHSQLALPANPQSPLLQYSFKELRQIEACEMQRLIDRLRKSRTLLTQVIAKPTLGVSYALKEYENSGCALSDKGKKIKQMRFSKRRKLGTDDNYLYGHAFEGVILYWLPVAFLP